MDVCGGSGGPLLIHISQYLLLLLFSLFKVSVCVFIRAVKMKMRRQICGIIMICSVIALNTCAVFLFALTVMKPEEGHFAEVQHRFKHNNTSVNLERKKKSPKYKDGKRNQYDRHG